MKTDFDFKAGEVLLIDKPAEWTSFDVVNKIRHTIRRVYQIRKIKVGHAGTLDPLATGLMIVCTGAKTKTINELTGLDKEYIATLQFGGTTPSFDMETPIEQTFDYKHITEEALLKTLQHFTGKIEQIPPAYSAKHINGERAYKHAREGRKVELKPIQVEIKELELLESPLQLPLAKLRIVCSKGTYIRTLVHDIGHHLQSGAYLASLHRSRIGRFRIEEAYNLKDFVNSLTKE